jgi:hypothetical protein
MAFKKSLLPFYKVRKTSKYNLKKKFFLGLVTFYIAATLYVMFHLFKQDSIRTRRRSTALDLPEPVGPTHKEWNEWKLSFARRFEYNSSLMLDNGAHPRSNINNNSDYDLDIAQKRETIKNVIILYF